MTVLSKKYKFTEQESTSGFSLKELLKDVESSEETAETSLVNVPGSDAKAFSEEKGRAYIKLNAQYSELLLFIKPILQKVYFSARTSIMTFELFFKVSTTILSSL